MHDRDRRGLTLHRTTGVEPLPQKVLFSEGSELQEMIVFFSPLMQESHRVNKHSALSQGRKGYVSFEGSTVTLIYDAVGARWVKEDNGHHRHRRE